MTIQTITIQCQHCHTQEQYKVGHSNSENTLVEAIDNFHGKTQIQLRSIIKKHHIDKAEFGYALFNCPECQTLYNPYAVEVEYDEIMLFKPFHKCQSCNTTLIRTTEAISTYTCKHCGEQQLHKI
jgi:predicted RNA-binding Zn-ribbon protein involved in translation (DUF1610 family)